MNLQVNEAISKKTGLSEEQVQASRREHGQNILTKQKQKSFLRHFFSNLNDPVIRILLCALILNLLLLFSDGDILETVGIGIAVFLATLISTLSEYGSAKAFARLSQESMRATCRVRRSNTVFQLPISDVVVGDRLLLCAGEGIPADGLLTEGDIKVDQSAMTGESKEVRKLPSNNFSTEPSAPSSVLRGCTVTSGSGEYCVTAVGDKTFLGQISREIQEEQRESPLKIRLAKLARQISYIGYAAAILVFLASLFNFLILDSGMNTELIKLKLTDPSYLLPKLLQAFTMALTVLVVAVPEGLPMMIAVVLSSNIRRMIRDQVLVRKPVGIEAAGSMNVLFTDKTGTLTEGKMKLSSFILSDGREASLREWLKKDAPPAVLSSLAFRFGTDASIGKGADGSTAIIGGSATERALLESVAHFPIPQGYRISERLPFDSARKYSSVSLVGKQTLTLLMGAPEKVLPFLSTEMDEHGKAHPFCRANTEKQLREHTEKGERVLAVTVSQESIGANQHKNGIRGSLMLLGFVCLSDPLRKEAKSSVTALKNAGIQVVMITGDNPVTAQSLAQQCGILSSENDLVLTSDEMNKLSDLRLRELLPRIAVVARALPTDKSRLVRLAQETGLVVGMTGDGINDAPALRKADVGFSMGGGTQVAKDAGDIIILDNNLASIVRAVLYGRNIFKSIRKFITLQLTMNFCAVGVTMICPFLGIDAPVTVVQMLWINLIMDTLGGLAFAGEAPLPECMEEPPKRRDEAILNRYMANQIVFLGGFTLGLCLFFLRSPTVTSHFRSAKDNIYIFTAFFALFIFSSVFNCFAARTDRLNLLAGLKKNPVFIGIMAAILVIQIVFVYLGGNVLRTAPLTVEELLFTMLLSLSVFPAEIIRKALWRLRGKKRGY